MPDGGGFRYVTELAYGKRGRIKHVLDKATLDVRVSFCRSVSRGGDTTRATR